MPKYKLVPGFPGYRVGDDGTVWSRLKTGGYGYHKEFRLHSQRPLNNGYMQTLLCEKSRKEFWLVHRLVLFVFVGPCPSGMEARHFPDRSPTNNNLSNLSWATKKRNDRDKDIHGTRRRGSRHGMAKLTEADVRGIRGYTGASQSQLARIYGVDQTMISGILSRKFWTHI